MRPLISKTCPSKRERYTLATFLLLRELPSQRKETLTSHGHDHSSRPRDHILVDNDQRA